MPVMTADDRLRLAFSSPDICKSITFYTRAWDCSLACLGRVWQPVARPGRHAACEKRCSKYVLLDTICNSQRALEWDPTIEANSLAPNAVQHYCENHLREWTFKLNPDIVQCIGVSHRRGNDLRRRIRESKVHAILQDRHDFVHGQKEKQAEILNQEQLAYQRKCDVWSCIIGQKKIYQLWMSEDMQALIQLFFGSCDVVEKCLIKGLAKAADPRYKTFVHSSAPLFGAVSVGLVALEDRVAKMVVSMSRRAAVYLLPQISTILQTELNELFKDHFIRVLVQHGGRQQRLMVQFVDGVKIKTIYSVEVIITYAFVEGDIADIPPEQLTTWPCYSAMWSSYRNSLYLLRECFLMEHFGQSADMRLGMLLITDIWRRDDNLRSSIKGWRLVLLMWSLYWQQRSQQTAVEIDGLIVGFLTAVAGGALDLSFCRQVSTPFDVLGIFDADHVDLEALDLDLQTAGEQRNKISPKQATRMLELRLSEKIQEVYAVELDGNIFQLYHDLTVGHNRNGDDRKHADAKAPQWIEESLSANKIPALLSPTGKRFMLDGSLPMKLETDHLLGKIISNDAKNHNQPPPTDKNTRQCPEEPPCLLPANKVLLPTPDRGFHVKVEVPKFTDHSEEISSDEGDFPNFPLKIEEHWDIDEEQTVTRPADSGGPPHDQPDVKIEEGPLNGPRLAADRHPKFEMDSRCQLDVKGEPGAVSASIQSPCEVETSFSSSGSTPLLTRQDSETIALFKQIANLPSTSLLVDYPAIVEGEALVDYSSQEREFPEANRPDINGSEAKSSRQGGACTSARECQRKRNWSPDSDEQDRTRRTERPRSNAVRGNSRHKVTGKNQPVQFFDLVNVPLNLIQRIGPDQHNNNLQAARSLVGIFSITKKYDIEEQGVAVRVYTVCGSNNEVVARARRWFELATVEETVKIAAQHSKNFTSNGDRLHEICTEFRVDIEPAVTENLDLLVRVKGVNTDVRRAVVQLGKEFGQKLISPRREKLPVSASKPRVMETVEAFAFRRRSASRNGRQRSLSSGSRRGCSRGRNIFTPAPEERTGRRRLSNTSGASVRRRQQDCGRQSRRDDFSPDSRHSSGARQAGTDEFGRSTELRSRSRETKTLQSRSRESSSSWNRDSEAH